MTLEQIEFIYFLFDRLTGQPPDFKHVLNAYEDFKKNYRSPA